MGEIRNNLDTAAGMVRNRSETMGETSPLPWKRGHTTSDGDIILDANGEYIGTMISEEDQKLVVASVNTVSELWAAINTFREEFAKCRWEDDVVEAFEEFDETIEELVNRE